MLQIGDKNLITTPFDQLDDAEQKAAIAYAEAIAHRSEQRVPAAWLDAPGDERRLAFALTHTQGVLSLISGVSKGLYQFRQGEGEVPEDIEKRIELARKHLDRVSESLVGIVPAKVTAQ